MAIVDSLFNVINEKIKEHNIDRVVQVRLVVGEMTGVEDMTMRACFELFAEATPVEGAELVIERMPIRAKCRNCGNEFVVRNMHYQCDYCGNLLHCAPEADNSILSREFGNLSESRNTHFNHPFLNRL